MSSLMPVFCFLLLLVPLHMRASHQEEWGTEWTPEQEQQSLNEQLVPLQTYNDHVFPHFIRYLIPGMTRRSITGSVGYGNAVGLPISTRTRNGPDLGYKTRYKVAEDAAEEALLRLQLLDPHGAGRRRRDTLSFSRLLRKRVLSLTKQH